MLQFESMLLLNLLSVLTGFQSSCHHPSAAGFSEQVDGSFFLPLRRNPKMPVVFSLDHLQFISPLEPSQLLEDPRWRSPADGRDTANSDPVSLWCAVGVLRSLTVSGKQHPAPDFPDAHVVSEVDHWAHLISFPEAPWGQGSQQVLHNGGQWLAAPFQRGPGVSMSSHY